MERQHRLHHRQHPQLLLRHQEYELEQNIWSSANAQQIIRAANFCSPAFYALILMTTVIFFFAILLSDTWYLHTMPVEAYFPAQTDGFQFDIITFLIYYNHYRR